MKIPLYDNLEIWIIQTVIDLILTVHQNLEIHLVNAASPRGSISKGVDGTDAEPMESK